MRPRPKDRGELAERRRQCGTGFNAATAQRPWGTASRSDSTMHAEVLQCGHGPKTVGNADPCDVGTPSEASMRPRPKDRGELKRLRAATRADPRASFNAATAQRPWGTMPRSGQQPRRASMRPRPKDRGERRSRAGAVSTFGRASMRPRPKDRGEREGLQPTPSASEAIRFNAATAQRPWRT